MGRAIMFSSLFIAILLIAYALLSGGASTAITVTTMAMLVIMGHAHLKVEGTNEKTAWLHVCTAMLQGLIWVLVYFETDFFQTIWAGEFLANLSFVIVATVAAYQYARWDHATPINKKEVDTHA